MTPSSRFVELDMGIHDRKSFDCGTKELNIYLQRFAVRHREAGISMTMVLPEKEQPSDISAFYTLTHTEIERRTLPAAMAKKLPRYPVPVLLLAQLAVNKDVQGQGHGKVTLIRALHHCLQINSHLPSHSVVVDALNNGVKAFYEQYGFRLLDNHNDQARLFLSMKAIKRLFTR